MSRTQTREKILDASAQLFRRQGYQGTGLKQIVAEGGAPWGSIYHFFPGGKEQLGVEAITRSGQRYEKLFDLVYERSDGVVGATREMFQLSAEALERSNFADGCPIATTAVETASTSEALRVACSDVLRSWTNIVVERLVEQGVDTDQAEKLATFVLAAFEGAIILARAHQDITPLATTADIVAATVSATLPN